MEHKESNVVRKEDELLYNTFRVVKELGRGGMGRVLQVEAVRASSGFNAFLAGAIAWQEVMEHEQIAPLRIEVTDINREMLELIEREAALMEHGDEKRADLARRDIDISRERLAALVDTIKKRQQYYIDKRSEVLTDADSKAMIMHLAKVGLPYPDDDTFALKQSIGNDERYRLRLQDEFRSVKLVQHKNIITAYSMGRDYYVTEFIHNMVPCEQILACPGKERQLYTNADRIRIIAEAARAVEHAHQFGVIHRDIKPDNIVVDGRGNVKLIDFGLVKSMETEGLTCVGVALGTPNFMSPEQIRSTKDATPTFDIYALGASLYTYLTGERPYRTVENTSTKEQKKTGTAQGMFFAILNPGLRPLRPTAIADAIPQVLEDIVMKAMAKEQELRYQSVREFREDLEMYLALADSESRTQGNSSSMPSKEVNMRVRRRQRRIMNDRAKGMTKSRKMAIGMVAVACLVMALAMVFALVARSGRTPAPAKESRPAEDTGNRALAMYEYALGEARKNPEDYEVNLERFNAVLLESRKTQYETMAENKLKEIKEQYTRAMKMIVQELDMEAQKYVQAGEYDKAICVYERYEGRFSKGIGEERMRKIKNLEIEKAIYLKDVASRQKMEEEQRRAKASLTDRAIEDARLQAVRRAQAKAELTAIARTVVKNVKEREYGAGLMLVNGRLASDDYAEVKGELQSMKNVILAARDLRAKLVEYLSANKGREIKMEKTNCATIKGVVESVEGDVVALHMELALGAFTSEKISLNDISLKQKMIFIRPDAGNPDILMALYLEAETQGNDVLKAAIKEKLGSHMLLTLLPSLNG